MEHPQVHTTRPARSLPLAIGILLASIGAQAWAKVDWHDLRVDPGSVVLECKDGGVITERRTRTDIAEIIRRGRSITGVIDREVDAAIRGYGWKSHGEGRGQTVDVVVPYHVFYRVPIQFGLRVDDKKMTTRVLRRWDGYSKLFVDRDMERFLTEKRKARIKQEASKFFEQRKAELADVTAWHDKQHLWNDGELSVLRYRGGSTFDRPLDYRFCNEERTAVFTASWRRQFDGPLGADKNEPKTAARGGLDSLIAPAAPVGDRVGSTR